MNILIYLPLFALRNLQRSVGDRNQLRYLTGDCFYETKQLRHQDRIHGSDIIRASMKHTHKPLTICESFTSSIASLSSVYNATRVWWFKIQAVCAKKRLFIKIFAYRGQVIVLFHVCNNKGSSIAIRG